MNTFITHLTLGLALGALAGTAVAEQEEPPLPPQIGEFVEPEESLEPEVRIIERGEQRIEEYRINGELYMIKVVPAKGPAYFLVDVDGDGHLDTRRNDFEPDVLVPRWTIFRWK